MPKKKSSPTKRLLTIVGIAVVTLVVLAIAANAFLGGDDDGLRVETTAVQQRDITQKVTASGRIQPEVEVRISPDVSGEITRLDVREGDWVRKGDLLVQIKPEVYLDQVAQAEAGVLQAAANRKQNEANVLKAKQDLERVKQLVERGVSPQAELQAVQAQYDIALANLEASTYQVQSAKSRMTEARKNLGRTSIYAPMDGTISQLNVEFGERVVGTSQMAGTELMRIARLDQMEVEVDINENDVVNVALGDTAAIEVDAYPDRRFAGIVTEIANSARVSAAGSQEQVTNFPVKIRILDPHNADAGEGNRNGGGALLQSDETPLAVAEVPRFRPGMSGTVDVFTHTVPNAVVVPIQAVTVRDLNTLRQNDEGVWEPVSRMARDSVQALVAAADERLERVVFIDVDGLARMVIVETGIADDTHIQVQSGLQGNEFVVTGPYRILSREINPGDAIQTDRAGRHNGPPVASN